MDIQHLVDRLEDLIDEGRHMPFSRYTMIDEEAALEIIDQMRISIPDEIEKAARILAQRDRVLAQANEEAARILQQARSKGEEMLDQDVSVQAAQNRAANVIEEARQTAQQITDGADNYVLQVLAQLEQQLIRNLNTVRNGISQVNPTDGQHLPSVIAEEGAPPAAAPAPQEQEQEHESVEVQRQQPPQARQPGITLRRPNERDED